MKIYGHPEDVSTRRVLLALAEKGHVARLVAIDVAAGEHQRPEHLARSPFGTIPALEQDGFELHDWSAILRYVDAALSGPRLTPQEPRLRARMDQWLSVVAEQVSGPLRAVQSQLTIAPWYGQKPDLTVVERGRKELTRPLALCEAALQQQPYLVGQELSLADLALWPVFLALVELGQQDLVVRQSALQRYWERLRARPAFVRALELRFAPAATERAARNEARCTASAALN